MVGHLAGRNRQSTAWQAADAVVRGDEWIGDETGSGVETNGHIASGNKEMTDLPFKILIGPTKIMYWSHVICNFL